MVIGSHYLQIKKPQLKEKLQAKLDNNPSALYKYDEYASYVLKPGFTGIRHGTAGFIHKTNSLGLLGTKEISHIPPGDDKILFLGDSVIYGAYMPYEKTLIPLMQDISRKPHLFNGSCPGWSTHQQTAFFEHNLSNIDWKAVILTFCMNDLIKFEWVYMTDKDFKMSEEMKGLGGKATRASEAVKIRNLRKKFRVQEKTAPLAKLNNTCLLAYTKKRWRSYIEDTLIPFNEYLKDTGQHLVMLILPAAPQIEALSLGASEDVVFFPQNELRSFCAKRGIPFIDASKFFYDVKIPLDEIFLSELHLSEWGHSILAEYIWENLEPALSQVQDRRQ